jgi:hypothetical protein
VRGGGNRYLTDLLEHIPGDLPHPVGECCRCIPRAIVFRFTPDDYTDDCCYPQSHVVHPTLENTGGWLKAVYEASVFGLTFELSVGRFSLNLDAYGYEDESAGNFDPYGYCDGEDPYDIGACAWRLRVYDSGTLIHYETFAITEDADCLEPPTVEYGPIDFPPQCVDGGYVSFSNFAKDKLAYVQNDNLVDEYSLIDLCPDDCGGDTPDCLSVQDDNVIREYSQIADVGGYPAWSYSGNKIQWDSGEGCWVMLDSGSAEIARGGTDSDCPLGVWTPANDYDEYGYSDDFCVSLCHSGKDYTDTDVSFVCGQCTQACKNVCVSGNWREDGWEFLGFTWTKQIVTAGTYPNEYQTLQQGWSYTDPVTDVTESLWLVDSDTGCQLVTDFSQNDQSTITITSGCSCDLFEQSHTQPWPGDVYWYSVHCGHCSEYSFYCGSCRCVPSRLCLLYILDGVATTQQVLDWDATNKQWGDDTADDVTVHLEADDYGECELVVYYEGSALSLYVLDDDGDQVLEVQTSSHDCEKESWTAHTDDDFDHPLSLPAKEGVRLTHRLKCRRLDSDWISLSHEGLLTQTSGSLFIHANSQQDQDCNVPKCGSVLDVCSDLCINNPAILNATVELQSETYPSYGEEWSFDVELHLVTQYQGGTSYYCAYVGTYSFDCVIDGTTYTEVWKIESQEGGLSFTVWYWVTDGASVVQRELIMTWSGVGNTVSCSPFYLQTQWEAIPLDDSLNQAELMCTDGESQEDQPYQARLTITE